MIKRKHQKWPSMVELLFCNILPNANAQNSKAVVSTMVPISPNINLYEITCILFPEKNDQKNCIQSISV